jgi:crossover junction endodeoxyribonuclease RuvC
MRILGIDPGLSTAGVGLIEVARDKEPVAIEWLTIETEAGLPLAERLLELACDLEEFLADAKPDLAVVEQLFFATNKKTAMDTAQARGVILLTLKKHGIDVREATPLQLKMAITGDGAADKKQMQEMVKRTLKLNELPSPADAADALALALYGAFTLQTQPAM